MHKCMGACVVAMIAGIASGQLLDGQNIAADAAARGMPLLTVQDTPTGFGNATGGGQDSAGGSELNAAWGVIDGGTLRLSMTGNLEGNFNKFWIFFDSMAGGQNVLANDNNDGGFNEINNMAGLTFDAGFAPNHGLRIEVGGGFLGINAFNLLDKTAQSVWTAGGPSDLPIANAVGGAGVSFGWDNSNVLGVDGSSAADALTADKGWEFEIDMAAFFGSPSGEVKVTAFITSGDAGFFSNQFLAGVGGLGNLGADVRDLNQVAGLQYFTIVPAPAGAALFGLAGLCAVRRRR